MRQRGLRDGPWCAGSMATASAFGCFSCCGNGGFLCSKKAKKAWGCFIGCRQEDVILLRGFSRFFFFLWDFVFAYFPFDGGVRMAWLAGVFMLMVSFWCGSKRGNIAPFTARKISWECLISQSNHHFAAVQLQALRATKFAPETGEASSLQAPGVFRETLSPKHLRSLFWKMRQKLKGSRC